MKKWYVHDIETIKNCFLAVFINVKNTKEIISFEVSTFKNDIVEYVKFLQQLIVDQTTLVTFNGLDFDSQVNNYILNGGLNKNKTGEMIADDIFIFVQKLIAQKNEKGYAIYRKDELPWKEIDLAAINNYNNQQKFASLKWLQFNMDWPNIIDMDCKPSDILGQDQIIKLKVYCINDCLSTRELLKRNLSEIKVRNELTKHFGIELQNLSEPKLAKAILGDLLAKDLDVKTVKDRRTSRKIIDLSEVILPYVSFITPQLKQTLGKFKSLKLNGENLKGTFKHKLSYRGLPLSFALGGIHGAKRGLYTSDDTYMIKSFDVKSYYPNLAIQNGWSPAHFPAEIFCGRYKWFYTERLLYPKSNPLNYMYKIVLNSVFGLSNEKNSFLKDPLLTMQITCNGQLLLVQLLEKLCEEIPGARPIMVNTDGGEIILPRKHEALYDKICKEWEEMTKLELEFEEYEKLIIWDVNNYIGVFKPYEIELDKATEMFNSQYPKPLIKLKKGIAYHYPIKLKGRFEIDKPLHKNKSYRVKSLAIYNYFIHNVGIEKTISDNKNIFDFCAGVRAKGSWKIVQTCVENGEIYNENSQKTIRYFRSPQGCKLIKKLTTVVDEDFNIVNKHGVTTHRYKKGDVIVKDIKCESDRFLENVLIKIDPKKKFEDYIISYDYYINSVREEIESVQPSTSQESLF